MLALACGDPDPMAAADADLPEELGQGSEPRADLIISEVSPRPAEGPDWIELHNRSAEPIDLCNYFVSDGLDRLDHYLHLAAAPPPEVCEPTLLAAGDFFIVYADDERELGPEHAPFKLGRADEVHIISTRGEAIDSLVYLHGENEEGRSLARIPTDSGLFLAADETPGEGNEVSP